MVSATNRNKSTPRRNGDTYQTDPKLAMYLVELLLRDGWMHRDARVLEPSAGDGSFVAAVGELCGADEGYLEANDTLYQVAQRKADDRCLPPSVAKHADHVTAHRFEDVDRGAWDLIVGNPPYSLAEAHIRTALKLLAPHGVLAFLLRLPFLESRERFPLWRDHPATAIYALSERPSFTGGGTDSTAYCMMVWQNARRIWPTRLEVVSWRGA